MQIQRYYIPINRAVCILFFYLFTASQVQAQIDFKDDQFSSVKVMDSIVYGSAKNFGGTEVHMALDLYLPDSIDNKERPLIIFSHGGSFLSGDRKSPDIIVLANALAKKGYICASIDYRKGINVLRDFKEEFAKAVYRATQDHRTAIRYFRKTYSNGNPYHIDTSQIFLAGVSAGAIASLHAAFQTELDEIPSVIPQSSMGGPLAGDHQFFKSNMKGVINLFGAISEKHYIDFPPTMDLCHLHGSSDQTVPYKSDTYSPNNIEIGVLHGSYIVDSIARSYGMNSDLKTLWNKGHVPYTRDSTYIDTTLNFIVDCMFDKVKLGKTVSIASNLSGKHTAPIWIHDGTIRLNHRPIGNIEMIEIFASGGQLVEKHKVRESQKSILLRSDIQGPHYVIVRSRDAVYSGKIYIR